MKIIPISLLAITASVLLLNCDCKHICTNPIPEINFINFDSLDLRTVIITSYHNNGKFDKLLVTQVYSNVVADGLDTMQMGTNVILLDFNTDYKVEVPATGKIWYIRNVSSQNNKMVDNSCTSGMNYYLNDTMHTDAPNSIKSNERGIISISK